MLSVLSTVKPMRYRLLLKSIKEEFDKKVAKKEIIEIEKNMFEFLKTKKPMFDYKPMKSGLFLKK
jgi:hypothetical protein